jgi:hypothetical protein
LSTRTWNAGLALALAWFVVASTVVAPVLAGSAVAQSDEGGPPGFVGVPDERVSENVPDHARGKVPNASAFSGVQTDVGADTLAVEVTTWATAQGREHACLATGGNSPGNGNSVSNGQPPFCEDPKLALNLTDDVNHDGRRVAVPADALESALGYAPTTAHVAHESGEEYDVGVSREGSVYVFAVEEFSTNSVTFSGEVELTGDPATHGTSYGYNLSDMDSASDPNVTFTGHTATEWDNVSRAAVSDGSTISMSVGGTADPTGPGPNGDPEITITGKKSTTSRSDSGYAWGGTTNSYSVGGTQSPTGPASGSPELSVTAQTEYTEYEGTNDGNKRLFGKSSGGWKRQSETLYENPPDKITGLRLHVTSAEYLDGDESVEIYIEEGSSMNGDKTEGTLVKTWNPPTSSGTYEIDIQNYSVQNTDAITVTYRLNGGWRDKEGIFVDGSSKSKTYWYWNAAGWNLGPNVELLSAADSVSATVDGTSYNFGSMSDGQTSSKAVSLTEGTTNDVSFSVSGGARLDYSLDWTEVSQTDSPSVDVDGDGNAEVYHDGLMTDGETHTVEVPEIGLSTSSLDVTTAAHTVDVDAKLKERTESDNPSVWLNGEQVAGHSGTLADGATANYSVPASKLQNGSNSVEVQVGEGLSADAPTPRVGFDWRHDARDDQSTEFVGESWSERYDVSKTWGDAAENATLKIPFAGNVVQNRDLVVYINGTETAPTWSRFDNTTLEVGLGDLAPGTTARVVANGSKVRVENGGIKVLDPTADGNALDTEFKIQNKSDGFRIAVGGTSSGDWVHYVGNVSWQNASASTRIANGGSDQYLRLPGAPEGGTAWARTMDVQADPQNDVVVEVEDPTEPRFHVKPGKVAGDSVTLSYHNTESGVKYQLISETNDRVEDSDTAESPVYFDLASDESNVLYIAVADSGGSTAGGGGGGGVPPVDTSSAPSDPLANPILVLGAGAVVILGVGLLARRRGVPVWASGGVLGLVFIVALESLAPRVLSGAFARVVAAVGQGVGRVSSALALGAGIIALWGVYRLIKKFTRKENVTLRVRRGN